jgi:hypothetical protein
MSALPLCCLCVGDLKPVSPKTTGFAQYYTYLQDPSREVLVVSNTAVALPSVREVGLQTGICH